MWGLIVKISHCTMLHCKHTDGCKLFTLLFDSINGNEACCTVRVFPSLQIAHMHCVRQAGAMIWELKLLITFRTQKAYLCLLIPLDCSIILPVLRYCAGPARHSQHKVQWMASAAAGGPDVLYVRLRARATPAARSNAPDRLILTLPVRSHGRGCGWRGPRGCAMRCSDATP